ncbi:hypothetical protein N7G274_010076 [Stereocaulon virgatum]|uniref:Uncharacterized protein n=1 Tax=Stereocaulon virgatum TaxID=373712 RepID=A0ABR3ZV88_9LECA
MQNSLTTVQRLKCMLNKAKSRTREDERTNYNKRAELLNSLRNDPAPSSSKASAGISSNRNARRRRIPQNPMAATQQPKPIPPAPPKQMVQTASSSASLQGILLNATRNPSATNSHASLSSRKEVSFELPSSSHDAVPSGVANGFCTTSATARTISFKQTCPIAYHYLQVLEHGDAINDWVSRKAFIAELDAVRIAMLEGCCAGSGSGSGEEGMRDLRAVQGIYCLVLGMGICGGV